MAVWGKRTLAGAEDAIAQFGRDLRFARTQEGLSQMSLEGRSGVDQTLISKLERAKAPHVSLERLIRLHLALGDGLPLGHCPHDHQCVFRHPDLVSSRRHVPRFW
jgi:transcriptional regulator with XRE-family HTH domain